VRGGLVAESEERLSDFDFARFQIVAYGPVALLERAFSMTGYRFAGVQIRA
jgi:hypothetical protein